MRPDDQRSSSTHSRPRSSLAGILADLIYWRRSDRRGATATTIDRRCHSGAEPVTSSNVWRTIQAARRKAVERAEATASTPTSFDSLPDEDLEFLRNALTEYDVLDRIRHGGQGAVYRACHRKTKRATAIKVLLAGPFATARQRARFEREAELTSRLAHPNIVTLYDYGIVRGRPYLAMQYVEGLPIGDYVVLHDLPPRDIVALIVNICRAVSYAHQKGVIHRDLNPSNILVDASGQPHVLDFGLAKDLWASEEAAVCSMPGQVVGTLPYMSPEQADGVDDDIDVRSDMYSLGVVLFGLLTDMMPYPTDGSSQRIRSAILSTDPLPLRKAIALGEPDRLLAPEAINHDLEMILGKVLAKKRAERYQSIAAFADDLERYLAGEAVAAKVGYRLYQVKKTIRKHRVFASVAALLLLVFASSSIAITMAFMQTRLQRDNARAVARIAQSSLNTTLNEIEEAIRPLAGGIAVRNRLLGGVADDLVQLRPLVESDAAMDDVLAALRERQGDIAHARGQYREAAEHYRAFLNLVSEAAHGSGADSETVAATIRACRKLASASESRDAHFERAIAVGEEFLLGHTSVEDVRYELCRARTEFSQYLFDAGRYDSVLEQVEAALALVSLGQTSTTRQAGWQQLEADAYALKGHAHLRLGNGALARQSLETALTLREALSHAHPTNVALRQRLMASYVGLGNLCRDDGQIEDAARLYRQAVGVGDYLLLADPDSARWKLQLYGAYDSLARLFYAQKNVEHAQVHCAKAIAVAESLVSSEPDNAEWLRILGFAHTLGGQTYVLQAAWPEACDSFERAYTIRLELATAAPANLDIQDELAVAHNWLARAYSGLGRMEEARSNLEQAHRIRKALLELQPEVTERSLGVILSQMKLATWHLDQRTAADDALAARLLAQAETSLLALHEAARLAALRGKYADWLAVIRSNQDLISRRHAKRLEAANVQDQPATCPSTPPQD